MTGYKSLRDKMNTGDIVLFSGKGPTSAFLKLAMKSKWTHVAVAWMMPEYDMLCIFESTMLSSLANVDTGEPRKGVQIVPASTKIEGYNGDVYVRGLFKVDITPKIPDLVKFRRQVNGRPYEQDALELAKAALDGPFGQNTEDLSSLFCSELVAEFYQVAGLLGSSTPSNEYIPDDFAGDLKLKAGELGPLVPLKEI